MTRHELVFRRLDGRRSMVRGSSFGQLERKKGDMVMMMMMMIYDDGDDEVMSAININQRPLQPFYQSIDRSINRSINQPAN